MTNKNNSQIILHYFHWLDFVSINVVFLGECIYVCTNLYKDSVVSTSTPKCIQHVFTLENDGWLDMIPCFRFVFNSPRDYQITV